MTYSVKEIFYTLQGEGSNAGRPAVFCRFAGCNLWTGREEDRAQATCQFCDTDFVGTDGDGGGKFATAAALVDTIASHWTPEGHAHRFVVLTGGEPLLQVDDALIAELHAQGFAIAVETNGTQPRPAGLDWVCVSPKAGTELKIRSGNELKLVFPQPGAEPEKFVDLDFQQFYLQPMDGPLQSTNTRLAMAYCMAHPQWSLGLQTHKFLQIR
jgi:7-carboxy-7-deazaguanine synthase (Cx14CxxC type)